MLKQSVAVIIWLLASCYSDVEHVQHSHSHGHHEHAHQSHAVDGNHNAEYDHEAILGSADLNDEFSKLSAHEAKQRLAILLTKMDVNGDKFISRTELSAWVYNNFKRQDETESAQKLSEADANGDSKVTWIEYALKVFGYTDTELDRFAQSVDPGMESFNKMVADEKAKFTTADKDRDGSLNHEEYSAFLHPHNYEYMHSYEIDKTLQEYDKNNDGTVSFEEYLGESKPDREQLIVDRENFDSYDTSRDGRLDHAELAVWVLPDRRSISDEEADHLISETDMNRDQLLTFNEILDRHDLWVGSAATDYGQELKHDPSEL